MFQSFEGGNTAIGNDDLGMMRSVLQRWCKDRGCEPTSPEAGDAAREMITWFQLGVTRQRQLRELLYSRP